MTWLVFGVSCLLVLAGAVSIISGAPIIQIERGWTEVIAGTVALSGGGIVFALAAILVRLESLRDALSVPRAAEAPTSEDPAALPVATPPPGVATPVQVMAPVQAPEETAFAAAPPPSSTDDNETGQGLWKRVKRPDAAVAERGISSRVTSVETSTPTPGTEPAVTPLVPTAPFVAIDRASETETTTANEPNQLGWLERSLFKGRPPKAVPDDRTPVLPERARTDPPSSYGQAAEARIEPALKVEPAHDIAPPTGPSDGQTEAAETEAGVTVIGRYQAGVASYVMYSDGTIEVETEGGQSHRFASMEELKAFIANQDNVLS